MRMTGLRGSWRSAHHGVAGRTLLRSGSLRPVELAAVSVKSGSPLVTLMHERGHVVFDFFVLSYFDSGRTDDHQSLENILPYLDAPTREAIETLRSRARRELEGLPRPILWLANKVIRRKPLPSDLGYMADYSIMDFLDELYARRVEQAYKLELASNHPEFLPRNTGKLDDAGWAKKYRFEPELQELIAEHDVPILKAVRNLVRDSERTLDSPQGDGRLSDSTPSDDVQDGGDTSARAAELNSQYAEAQRAVEEKLSDHFGVAVRVNLEPVYDKSDDRFVIRAEFDGLPEEFSEDASTVHLTYGKDKQTLTDVDFYFPPSLRAFGLGRLCMLRILSAHPEINQIRTLFGQDNSAAFIAGCFSNSIDAVQAEVRQNPRQAKNSTRLRDWIGDATASDGTTADRQRLRRRLLDTLLDRTPSGRIRRSVGFGNIEVLAVTQYHNILVAMNRGATDESSSRQARVFVWVDDAQAYAELLPDGALHFPESEKELAEVFDEIEIMSLYIDNIWRDGARSPLTRLPLLACKRRQKYCLLVEHKALYQIISTV